MSRLIARCVCGLLLIASSTGCTLICMSQQHRGPVKTLDGVVQPGDVITIELPYDAHGDQNDLKIAWDGQRDVDGPRPRFYLTEIDCVNFIPPPANQRWVREDACRSLGGSGGFKNSIGEIVQTSLTVVGGPHQGPTNALRKAYKLHIAGDATRPVHYTVLVTWYRGANC